MRHEQHKEQLEAAVDGLGLQTLVDMLAEICYEKADHILSSYDDKVLCDLWGDAADAFARLAGKSAIINVSLD